MKLHKKLLLFGASALLLAGCGADQTAVESEDTAEVDKIEADEASTEELIEEAKEQSTGEDYEAAQAEQEEAENSLEIDENQPLENIGEYKYVIDGRVELVDIFRPTETYSLIDGVDINFKDIKVIHMSEIPESEKEFVRNVYGFDDEGYTIQFAYSVTNNTDETVGGIEIEDIVTSNGNQYNIFTDGGPVMGSSYEVRPRATTDVGVVFSIQEPDVSSLTLYFQPLEADGLHMDETSIELTF